MPYFTNLHILKICYIYIYIYIHFRYFFILYPIGVSNKIIENNFSSTKRKKALDYNQLILDILFFFFKKLDIRCYAIWDCGIGLFVE